MAGESIVKRQLPISVKLMNFATGTWTFTNSSGVVYMAKTDADTTTTLSIPVMLPRKDAQHGVRLNAIKLPVRVATENLDSEITATLYRQDFDAVVAAASGDVAGTAITVTTDGTATADSNDRMFTISVSSPDWDYGSEAICCYIATVTINAADSSSVRVYDAIAFYDELV